MEQYAIFKLLSDTIVSKFVTRKWIKVNYLFGSQYFVDKNIRFKTLMLKSDSCNYSESYIVVKGTINL